jgi:GrpB-like predicted nucleotidyltransferase (UPF0157 family)
MFEALSTPIWKAVADIAVSIAHVGSTAVPGLAAKPIIDLDVIVPSRAEMSDAVKRLGALGYVHRGDLGVEGREAFQSPAGLPAHHLYVCAQDNEALKNHLAIRDSLRRDPAAAMAYGALKKQLAEECAGNSGKYVEGKTAFLLEILRKSGFSDTSLDAIREANRAKS